MREEGISHAIHLREFHCLPRGFLGERVIAAPDGQEAARAGDTPQVIYADLDPENVSWAQDRVPYLSEMDSLRLK
ncbi:hypothetical protein [Marivita sp. XM-24bin2]|jgi:predicted amidohydrolase|uniref:hypothetical protein n=1 Tax=unclassified Marivita TaxID=2632480 RepID=UPI000D7AB1B1|nr:hypothetical protein [Marivita sp. XM-24bin2]MCR9108212.1 hypothetical protein [Paracoccaceae bacterium]PWL37119.1 MAG: hypothetical protein DCO97_00955 [Marivita sp. XM-24bin2]